MRVHDTAADPRYIASHPDIRSEVAVPLIIQDRVVGRDGSGKRPRRLLHRRSRPHADTARAAGGIERGERAPLQATGRSATGDGRRPAARRANCSGSCCRTPSRRSRAWRPRCVYALRAASSGDIYDILEQPGGQSIIAFGDVSGKGAAAALYGGIDQRPAAHSGQAAAQPGGV